MSVIEAPNHLTDVHNTLQRDRSSACEDPAYYRLSEKVHQVSIPLRETIVLFFPSRMVKSPTLIHEDWDYNMHLMKFSKNLNAGETVYIQFRFICNVNREV